MAGNSRIKLNNSFTNWAFQKIFSKIGFVASCSLKIFYFSHHYHFAVYHVTSFSRQKPLKFEKQKHTIVYNTKFYNPAKFELKQIQTLKVVH